MPHRFFFRSRRRDNAGLSLPVELGRNQPGTVAGNHDPVVVGAVFLFGDGDQYVSAVRRDGILPDREPSCLQRIGPGDGAESSAPEAGTEGFCGRNTGSRAVSVPAGRSDTGGATAVSRGVSTLTGSHTVSAVPEPGSAHPRKKSEKRSAAVRTPASIHGRRFIRPGICRYRPHG